jgi:hypothetical protein
MPVNGSASDRLIISGSHKEPTPGRLQGVHRGALNVIRDPGLAEGDADSDWRLEEAITAHQDAAAVFRETGDRRSLGRFLARGGRAARAGVGHDAVDACLGPSERARFRFG